MCEYCNGDPMTQQCLPDPEGVRFFETGVFAILKNTNGRYLIANVYDGSGIAQCAEIKYCPMCGRELGEA